jgi:hypothetical protein
MYNQADQFSKSLLRDALSCAAASTPGTEVEVTAATQKIDVYAVPDPARAAEREKMGLLGELFLAPSLFEPFRNTPNLAAIRRVLCKQLVLAELPRTRETLLLRLLGAGALLAMALDDFDALPADAWERGAATPVLVQFGRARLRKRKIREEDGMRTEIQAWFEDYQRDQRREGRAETRAGAVLTVLRVRGIAVPDGARERILSQKDPERLERWLEKAILATSIAEVIDDPS